MRAGVALLDHLTRFSVFVTSMRTDANNLKPNTRLDRLLFLNHNV